MFFVSAAASFGQLRRFPVSYLLSIEYRNEATLIRSRGLVDGLRHQRVSARPDHRVASAKCNGRGSITVKPTVLVVTTRRWFSTARLAMALSQAGFTVDVICPTRHPVKTTTAVRRLHPYSGLAPLTSLLEAIAAAKPDLIIPSDDLASRHLHDLHGAELRDGNSGSSVCALIERSLGARDSFSIVYQRAAVLKLAREAGIRVPDSRVIRDQGDLARWIERMGLPVVLKSNGTSGGEGVRIVHTPEDAHDAFQVLSAPPPFIRAVKRALADQDLTLIPPMLLRRGCVVSAHTFVAGRDATSLVACCNGVVLAALHFEVINKQDSTGPASVLRVVDNPEMSDAAEKIVRRLNLSGLHGFDFLLEAETGKAYLIELNPRTTQVAHLRLGPGRDLPAALYAVVSGNVLQEAAKVTENETITLFPQEWTRNPESPFLLSGYHDIPWEEPELIRACLRRPWKWGAWKSQRTWAQALSTVRRLRL